MAKKSAWKEHESCSPGLVEGRYARLSNSQMLHPKMRKLGANALKLYLYMKLEYEIVQAEKKAGTGEGHVYAILKEAA